MKAFTMLALAFVSVFAFGQDMPGHEMGGKKQTELPTMPTELPRWISSPGADHLFYKAGPYNWAINRIPKFAKDMYATGVGHAMGASHVLRPH